jgi:hypothetical protein
MLLWNNIPRDSNLEVRFEIIAAATMRTTLFLDVMACGLVYVYQHFGETSCFGLQGRRIWR